MMLSRRTLFVLAVGLLSGLNVERAAAFQRALKSGPATLELRTAVDAVAVTDAVTVILTLDAGPGLEVAPPRLTASSAAWLLVEQRSPTSEPIAPDRVHWRQISLLAPVATGPQSWQFPPLRYRDHSTDGWQEIAWPPLEIPVAAPSTDAEKDGLRDITAIEAPALVPPRTLPVWLGISVVLIPIAVLIGLYLRRRTTLLTRPEPGRIALLHVQRLIGRRLPERGQPERFVTLLTLIVRRYLEKQYHLAARRQTTAELLHSVAGHGSLTASQRQFLESFLPRCDLIKFAGADAAADAAADEPNALAEAVQRFVAETDRSHPTTG
jgi:hypothetical protein